MSDLHSAEGGVLCLSCPEDCCRGQQATINPQTCIRVSESALNSLNAGLMHVVVSCPVPLKFLAMSWLEASCIAAREEKVKVKVKVEVKVQDKDQDKGNCEVGGKREGRGRVTPVETAK